MHPLPGKTEHEEAIGGDALRNIDLLVLVSAAELEQMLAADQLMDPEMLYRFS